MHLARKRHSTLAHLHSHRSSEQAAPAQPAQVAPLIHHIRNSVLVLMFQGLFKPVTISYERDEERKKKKKPSNILAAVNKTKKYAKIPFPGLPALMHGNKYISGHLFSGFFILCCP